MNATDQIRTLFAREHDTIFPGLGVFLGGPTPPNGDMIFGWRRKVIAALSASPELDASMIVVAPEPETGQWSDLDAQTPKSPADRIREQQIPWELQYLQLCDITAFWMPTYWDAETSGKFAPNIGPTTRWEFGYFLQEYLKQPQKRKFIIGGPEDAESIKWAKLLCDSHQIPWHYLPASRKDELVAASFIEAIKAALVERKKSMPHF